MDETVYLLNMFPDYVPPEELREALSQAAIAAADIHPETRGVSVAVHSDRYIPQRLLDQPRCVLTPHHGSNAADTREAMMRAICGQILDVLAGRRPVNIVNGL